MPREIVSEEEIPLAQVKKVLTQRKKEGELSFQQSITLEHASTFSKISPAKARKLIERFIKKYDISRPIAVQIANIAPITVEELRTILGGKASDFDEEQLIEIVDHVIKNRS